MNDPSRDVGSVVLAPLHRVYLCGPITGPPVSEVISWRHTVIRALAGEADIIDPTRDLLSSIRQGESASTRVLSVDRLVHGKRTVTRDRFDVSRSDLILACFLGAKSVSIGSIGEIFWADSMRKPVIIVREEDNIHNHDMLNEIAGWIFDDLGAAIEQVRRLIRLR